MPTQFVMFNLSAIVGSAILYGDFKRASFHQIVTFLYGCAATFAGVFIIAWVPTNKTPEGPGEVDEEVDGDLEAGRTNDSNGTDRKSTRLNSSHSGESRMPSSA